MNDQPKEYLDNMTNDNKYMFSEVKILLFTYCETR